MSRLDDKRPSIYDEGVLEKICRALASGISISRYCNENRDVPVKTDVYLAMAVDSHIAQEIAKARAAQQDAIVDEMIDLADAATVADWQVVKLRIQQRQWQAERLAPKKYGMRVELNGGLTLKKAEEMTDEELATLINTAPAALPKP